MMPLTLDPALPYDRAERGWGCLDTARGRLPLAAVDVDVRIVGLEATTEVRQTFVNHLREPIEATYVFPLPDRAAVTRFRMQVGARVIEGKLDERGAARAAYDQAIATGHRAAIAEEDRAGVFTLRVGNLMPGDVAIVALSLSGPLPVDDGEVTWMFPLVVAPRYIPGAPLPGDQAGLGTALDTDQVPDASRITPPVILPGMPNPVRLGVRVAIDGGGLPLAQLRGNLAELDAHVEGATWQVVLRPGQRLDRDLVLRWQIGGAELRSSAVWTPDADGTGGGTIAVTIVPPVASAAADRPRDVVIVLDRSGSMGGWKMVAARRAAARIVDSLTSRDGFAVLAFDNAIESPRALGSRLAAATDRNRYRAVEFLATIEARGGTELAQPLQLALTALGSRAHEDARTGGRDQIVILVTDGQVGNEDMILQQLGGQIGQVRVFTLGIDQAVNAAFLRRLAGLGGGACELVESEDRLDEVMGKIHRRIATPLLTGLAISGVALDPTTQTPRRLPALYAGAPVTVWFRAAGRPVPGQAIDVTGRLPAGTSTSMRVALDSAWPGVNLEAAWARAHIRDLEDTYAARGGNDPELERRIVATSLRHRVLSRFTAFVAIDLAEIANRGHAPRTIVQPVETPAGWASQGQPIPPPPGRPPGMPMPMQAPMPIAAQAMPTGRLYSSAAPSGPLGGPPPMPGGGPPSMPGLGGPPSMPGGGGFGGAPGLPGARHSGGFGGAAGAAPPASGAWSSPADADDEALAELQEESTGAGLPGLDRLAERADKAAAPKRKREESEGARAPMPRVSRPAPALSAPAKAPPAPPRPAPASMPPRAEPAPGQAAGGREAGIDQRPYLQRLAAVIDQLTAAATAPQPVLAAQLPVARLAELVEDLRSVGLATLAHSLSLLLDRLRAALDLSSLASTLVEVADLLRQVLHQGPSPGGRPAGRSSFWK